MHCVLPATWALLLSSTRTSTVEILMCVTRMIFSSQDSDQESTSPMMLPFLKQFHEIVTNSATVSNDLSTIYSPGLVSKKDECASFIRSSADGVSILFSHDHSEVVPIPIEIKSRKSVRTFRIRISNWQLRFEDDAEVVLHDVCERNVLFTQFPAQKGSRCHLLFKHCIPDAHERIQLLHHACIYQSKRAFFVVAKDKDVCVCNWQYIE